MDLAIFRQIANCRSCGNASLLSVLDLGEIHLNAFPLPEEPNTPKTPLELVLCNQCSLLQLRHTTQADSLYKQFWYKSATTQTMRDALRDVVEGCKERARLAAGDTVIDIGSNDSCLLSWYPENVERIGFEPAENLMGEARKPGLTIVNDYFSKTSLREVSGKRAKVITAIAMFYDLDDPHVFLADVFEALSPDGVFCIQQAYLPKMLKRNDLSNICQEHLGYYSLLSLEPLLRKHNLRVFDIEENDINGGSFRTYICQMYSTKFRETEAVRTMRFTEKAIGLDLMQPYAAFAERCKEIRTSVRKFLFAEKEGGRKVYGYGASTKSQTLISYWGLGKDVLQGIADRDDRKHGRRVVNGGIPIVGERSARISADTFLVFPWFFRAEFLKREGEWLGEAGHKMVFPMPEFEVITGGESNDSNQ